ncbi:MAG: 5'-nucleotidase C-terminal domain-containing protein [Prevotella sp.]|nr:5'-nucleotidase C-terminal domain-containing protein [Prevotella sp.]
MKKKTIILTLTAVLTATTACTTHYTVSSVSRSRILVDARYDVQPDAQAAAFLAPYKHVVDSVMGPKVGRTARYLFAQRPEGTLSNLLADILVWAGKDYGEQPVVGVYNMGGVRAGLPEGDITYGDVLDVAPFENKICFLTLSGTDLLELFGQIAATGGEGVSHGVELVISKSGQLLSAKLNGEPIEPTRDYRLTTIDYLLQGNDKMRAFRKGRAINSPQDESNNSRFIIMNYFKAMTAEGKVVDAQIEGRITVKE